MIGVSYGAPTEFRSNGRIIRWQIDWKPEHIANSIQQDDLYVEMTFAEVLDKVGLDATTEQFGEMFKDSKYNLWHANASARYLLNRGIKAPWSGHPKFNPHANDIDFQIESDFIGLMTPGLPQQANIFADRVGRVMNYGDGLYGGLFFAGMYSAAFFESDPRKVVEIGLKSIPADSGYGRIIRDLLDWSATEPDWEKTWGRLTEKWDRDDACPDGALNEFNIDARLNGAFVALGLIYGKGDFDKTLEVSTRAGQDSDCNPSSAAGILGVILGWRNIPDKWKSGIPAIADRKFDYTSYSFNGIIDSTVARALKVVERAGGKVTDDGDCRARRGAEGAGAGAVGRRRAERARGVVAMASGPGARDGATRRGAAGTRRSPRRLGPRQSWPSAAPASRSWATTTTRAGRRRCSWTARRPGPSTRAR